MRAALVLGLVLAPAAVGAEPALADGAPSLGWAAARLVGVTVGLALLLGAGLTALLRRLGGGRRRGLGRWGPEPAPADRLRVVSRSWLGARESLAVVQVGSERFLIGVAGSAVSLLARLAGPGPGERPAPADFAAELDRAAAVGPAGADALRAALARTEARLARLTGPVVAAGERHG